jgi:transposase-like protein
VPLRSGRWDWQLEYTSPGEKIVKDIKRATRKQYSFEEKIRIVLDGLRSEDSIAEVCRGEGISQGIYYKWSKDFMEAGKKRLSGDTARAATTDEVKDLHREARDLKEVVAEQTLELRILKETWSRVGAIMNEVPGISDTVSNLDAIS